MERFVEIVLCLAVELFTKDSNQEDDFWKRASRKANSWPERSAPGVYVYDMNIGETGRLVVNCRIKGCRAPGGCQIPECCNIPLRAKGVAVKVDGHPWHDLQEFKQGLNTENPREIVAHLTEDAFRVDAMQEASRRHGDTLSNKYVRIGVKVIFDVENAPHIKKETETEMYCRVCYGSVQRFVGQTIAGLHARMPQFARDMTTYLEHATLGVWSIPRRVLVWRPRRRSARGRTRRSDRTHS